MAKKAETISLIDTFAEFKETKNIDRATLVSVLEESFRSVIAKLFGSDDNYDVIVNPDKGDFEIYRNRTVVADGEVKDDNREISLTEARQIDEDYEVGEEVSENVDFAKFGRRAILTLRQTLSAGDYAAAESDLAALKAAVLKRDHGSYTSQEDIQAQIKSVESEIQQQKAALSGAKTVTAKASGTYSAVCDGYESVLTEAFLEDVTPGKLNGVKAAAEQSNVGKLIYGDTWYYAVVLPAEQAAALKDMGRVDVRLAKGFDQSIRMSVVSVSREENGQAAVVLSSTRYLAQTTLLRRQAADAVLHTYQGLRVPADALRVSADGTTGVYCVDGENASFRPIELVYQGEGYALVKPAEGVRDTQTLRSGDQVIATSGELYDGKVIR